MPVVAIPPAYNALGQKRSGCVAKRLYLLGQVRHRERLVEQPQLPALALFVVGIAKDATVQQRPVNVRHHGPDVPRAVRLAGARELDGLEVLGHRRVEVHRVALVERVDLAAGGDRDLWNSVRRYARERSVSDARQDGSG